MNTKLKGVGLFALGALFGLEGVRLLTSKDAKKAYAHCVAGVLRAKDSVIDQVASLQENCCDIYEEAKEINEERANKEAEACFFDENAEEGSAAAEEEGSTEAENEIHHQA